MVHDACALTSVTPRTSPVNSKGPNGAAERAVQSVKYVAQALRLDVLHRASLAVNSELPITSWMERHATCGIVDESRPSWRTPMERRRTLDGSCGKTRRFSLEGTDIFGWRGEQPASKWGDSCRAGLGNASPVELIHLVEPTWKVHAFVEENDESIVPKREAATPFAS